MYTSRLVPVVQDDHTNSRRLLIRVKLSSFYVHFFWKANKLVETDVKRVTNRTEQTNAGLVAQLLFLSFPILNWIPIQTTHDYLPNFYFLSFSIYIWIPIQATQDKKPCTFDNTKEKSIWIRISIETISRGPTRQDNFYIRIQLEEGQTKNWVERSFASLILGINIDIDSRKKVYFIF